MGTTKPEKIRINVYIPLTVSFVAVLFSYLGLYYFGNEPFSFITTLHIFNTSFIPTHIATTICYLYEYFILNKIVIKDVWRTILVTISLTIVYMICEFKVSLLTQIVLFISQFAYIIFLLKYELQVQEDTNKYNVLSR